MNGPKNERCFERIKESIRPLLPSIFTHSDYNYTRPSTLNVRFNQFWTNSKSFLVTVFFPFPASTKVSDLEDKFRMHPSRQAHFQVHYLKDDVINTEILSHTLERFNYFPFHQKPLAIGQGLCDIEYSSETLR